MATFASLQETILNTAGNLRFRQAVKDFFAGVKTAMAKLDSGLAPKFTLDATAVIALTAATHWTDAQGHIHREATLYTSSGTAVAVSFAKTQSDLLPIGTILNVIQSAGAVTITGSGGLTVTARGVIAGNVNARAHKVTAALWLIDYPAPHA